MILHDSASSMTERQPIADSANEKHSLYLRFPKKLNADRTLAESQVKSLNSKIIRVRIPRQRSANFCLVDFASSEDKDRAAKKLKKVEVNNKLLVVKEATRNDKGKVRKRIEKIRVTREVNEALGKLVGDIKNSKAKKYGQRNVTNGVIVKDLKVGTTQGNIRQAFPMAIDIKLNAKADRKNSYALVWLPTPQDAREAASEPVQINGDEYVVCLENDGKQMKRKRINKWKGGDGGDDDEDDSSDDASVLDDSNIDVNASEESDDDVNASGDSDVDMDENVDSESVDESD